MTSHPERRHCNSTMASVNLPPERWLFKMLLVLFTVYTLFSLVSCELVPAMFDPETKQVYYNPQAQSQMSGANKDLVVTVAQDVKVESSSRASKSENFGLNLGMGNMGIPTLGVNYQKTKIHETRQESHHQVNIAIKIPGDCNEGCKEQANQAFQLANNALHGGSKQKRVN